MNSFGKLYVVLIVLVALAVASPVYADELSAEDLADSGLEAVPILSGDGVLSAYSPGSSAELGLVLAGFPGPELAARNYQTTGMSSWITVDTPTVFGYVTDLITPLAGLIMAFFAFPIVKRLVSTIRSMSR